MTARDNKNQKAEESSDKVRFIPKSRETVVEQQQAHSIKEMMNKK